MPDLAEGDRELVILRGLGYNSEGAEGHPKASRWSSTLAAHQSPLRSCLAFPEDRLARALLCSRGLTGTVLTEGRFHSQ